MKLRNIFCLGFSLVEVLVAIGLLSASGYGIMRVSKFFAEGGKSIELDLESTIFLKEIQSALSNNDRCKDVVNSKNKDKINELNLSKKLSISSIEIFDNKNKTSGEIKIFDFEEGTEKSVIKYLELTYSKDRAQSGGKTHKFPLIPVYLHYENTNSIKSCTTDLEKRHKDEEQCSLLGGVLLGSDCRFPIYDVCKGFDNSSSPKDSQYLTCVRNNLRKTDVTPTSFKPFYTKTGDENILCELETHATTLSFFIANSTGKSLLKSGATSYCKTQKQAPVLEKNNLTPEIQNSCDCWALKDLGVYTFSELQGICTKKIEECENCWDQPIDFNTKLSSTCAHLRNYCSCWNSNLFAHEKAVACTNKNCAECWISHATFKEKNFDQDFRKNLYSCNGVASASKETQDACWFSDLRTSTKITTCNPANETCWDSDLSAFEKIQTCSKNDNCWLSNLSVDQKMRECPKETNNCWNFYAPEDANVTPQEITRWKKQNCSKQAPACWLFATQKNNDELNYELSWKESNCAANETCWYANGLTGDNDDRYEQEISWQNDLAWKRRVCPKNTESCATYGSDQDQNNIRWRKDNCDAATCFNLDPDGTNGKTFSNWKSKFCNTNDLSGACWKASDDPDGDSGLVIAVSEKTSACRNVQGLDCMKVAKSVDSCYIGKSCFYINNPQQQNQNNYNYYNSITPYKTRAECQQANQNSSHLQTNCSECPKTSMQNQGGGGWNNFNQTQNILWTKLYPNNYLLNN